MAEKPMMQSSGYKRGTSQSQQTRAAGRLRGQHIVSIKSFEKEDVEVICDVSNDMRQMIESGKSSDLLRGKIVSNIFFEASTRTHTSFDSAAQRLGAGVHSEKGVEFSSMSKGESFEDTMRAIEIYSDVVVLRHPETGAAARAAAVMKKPLINAGDGKGEHPTQALLDLYTIKRERGTVDGLTITMLGDLKYGRTVHSLARLLSMYDVKLRLVSPEILMLPDYLRMELKEKNVEFLQSSSLEDVLDETDVLYVTRVQKERFEAEGCLDQYEEIKNAYVVDAAVMSRARPKMVLMHPLPRVNEIAREVDTDDRAAYFRQMECGLYVRMALLAMVLGKA